MSLRCVDADQPHVLVVTVDAHDDGVTVDDGRHDSVGGRGRFGPPLQPPTTSSAAATIRRMAPPEEVGGARRQPAAIKRDASSAPVSLSAR